MAILRVQRFKNVSGMLRLYKAKIFAYAECRTAAIYHSSVRELEAMNRIQRSFQFNTRVEETSALLVFNLAPKGQRTSRSSSYVKIASTDAARDDQGTTVNCTNTGNTIMWMRSDVRRWV